MCSTHLVSLDPGKVTGWAVFDVARGSYQLERYGVIDSKSNAVEDILCAHWNWLNDERAQWGHPFSLAFEAPILSRALPQYVEAHEARGVIRLFSLTGHNCCAVASYSPAKVKTVLTGKGNANKREVMQAIKELYGIARFKTDHEPDAIAVGVAHLYYEYGLAPRGARTGVGV